MRHRITLLSLLLTCGLAAMAQRSEVLLQQGWRFHRGDVPGAEQPSFDDRQWQAVTVPHDWAITGPFGSEHDLQNVAVTQNGEKQASLKTGRTGGLPYIGVGWYRVNFKANDLQPKDETQKPTRTTLIFDGAMSEARVYVNGKEAIFWPYGYNSFHRRLSEVRDDE